MKPDKNARCLSPQDESLLNTILSNIPAVIYSYQIVDGKRIFTYISQNIINVLGFEPQEIMGDPSLWTGRIHPADLVAVESVPERLEREQTVRLEYRFNCKLGLCRWLHEKQNVITGAAGEKEVIAVCWDITAQKLAEQLIRARVNLLTFSHTHSLDEVLQKTLDEVCTIVNSPLGFYHFVNAGENTLTLRAARSAANPGHFCAVKDKKENCCNGGAAGIWLDCLYARRPVIRNGYASLARCRELPADHAGYGAGAGRGLAVPIMRQNRVVAILGVANKPLDYTEQDVQVVSYFADLAWSVAEYKQSEEKVRYFSFHDTLTGLYNRVFLEEEMQRFELEKQFPISIVMADLNGLKLVNDTYGHNTGDQLLKTVASILRKSCRKEDVAARWGGDEFVILLPRTSGEEAENLCKRIRSKCRAAFVEDVPVSLALGVAAREDINTALDDVLKEAEDRMYKQKLAESRSIRSAVLNALLKTLGAKSFETEEHVCRMQVIALEFGEKLGLLDSELDRLSLLVTLHDIGKINIPEEILTKKGPLTAAEWETMKKHPETGFRIARSTEEFAHVAADILAHHERWDGTGYPLGLKGEQIPLLARITAIIDAYEVMTNGRPYKKRLSATEAIAEIKKGAGKQFDPVLVELFLAEIVEDGWYLPAAPGAVNTLSGQSGKKFT